VGASQKGSTASSTRALAVQTPGIATLLMHALCPFPLSLYMEHRSNPGRPRPNTTLNRTHNSPDIDHLSPTTCSTSMFVPGEVLVGPCHEAMAWQSDFHSSMRPTASLIRFSTTPLHAASRLVNEDLRNAPKGSATSW
jgi:hypothetical protein